MNDTRARLLAIMNEPDRYFTRVHNETLLDVFDRQSTRICKASITTGEYLPTKQLCIDLNARWRLKRLCEEMAKIAEEFCPPIHTHASENSDRYRAQDETCHLLAKKFRAIGEDNEAA